MVIGFDKGLLWIITARYLNNIDRYLKADNDYKGITRMIIHKSEITPFSEIHENKLALLYRYI